MSNRPEHDQDAAADAPRVSRRPPLLAFLSILLLAEAAAMVGIVLWLLIELLTQEPAALSTALAILVLAVLGAVFILSAAIGSLRAASWIRGAAFVWQLIQTAIAVGCFQGAYAQPAVGWTLLVPSLLGIVLLLSPSVTRALGRA